MAFAPSPPLTIGLAAAMLAGLHRIPFVYNVQEIYPDIAVDLGVLRNRTVIWILHLIERFIYRRASAVVVISESFRRRLLAKGVPEDKLHVIPNFVDVEFVRPGDRDNSFSRQHGLSDRFVVQYSGNIGLTQDLDGIITAAQLLSDLPNIRFLVVGDGTRREWLERQIVQKGISNIQLLPYQPRGVVPELYASSDVCLVPLRKSTGQTTFPSKIYTIMSAAKPAIVCADADSDLSWTIEQASCGFLVPPGNPEALARTIRDAYERRELLSAMGQGGRRYVEENHSPEKIALQYHRLLTTLAKEYGTRR